MRSNFCAAFVFNGHVRWDLGWANPNHAGAFLAMLLPLLWFGQSSWHERWPRLGRALFILVEAVLWFALAKTYSRGGLIAGLVAGGWWILIQRGCFRKDYRINFIILRFGIVLFCLYQTGLQERLAPGFIRQDHSVTNRIDLWKAGLKMISVSPLKGWGEGSSGAAYMNWFQSVDRSENYTTMVNGFLHLAVEHGLPFTYLVLALLAAAILLYARITPMAGGAPWFERLGQTASTVLVAWGIANIFSTLWTLPELWSLPALALVLPLLLLGRVRFDSPVRLLTWGAGASAALCLLSIAVGSRLPSDSSARVSRESSQIIVLNKAELLPSSEKGWDVWLDRVVLGPTPGKEMRRWLATPAAPRLLKIRDSAGGSTAGESVENLMLFGEQAERLGRDIKGPDRHLVLIHPRGELPLINIDNPPATNRGAYDIRIILPQIDQDGQNIRWARWARQHGATITYAASVGVDARAVWPELTHYALE